jgi:glycerophosphoryl diester phosphodiesterase
MLYCTKGGDIMFEKKFCAHRGVSALMPENTLPAFAAALALGAEEIELDVRLTKDNKMVICHDPVLERISDGCGYVSDYTLEELRKLNVGIKQGWQVGFCTPEEVYAQLANKITFNIHLKQHGEDGYIIRELLKLTEQYNAFDSVYFAGSPSELEWMERVAPNIRRVAIQLPGDTIGICEMAKKYNCSGVQFWLDMFDESHINTLHSQGIWCNLFYADDAENYKKYFDMGIDTILTNRMDLAAEYRKNNMNI